MILFPSPTGVNYYELSLYSISGEATTGFRPQQGLTIMNFKECQDRLHNLQFPSPTGVNYYECVKQDELKAIFYQAFPSPTGVNYYELMQLQLAIHQS